MRSPGGRTSRNQLPPFGFNIGINLSMTLCILEINSGLDVLNICSISSLNSLRIQFKASESASTILSP